MPNTIEQYREAKASFERLHSQAKRELVARFNELAAELLQIQRELKEDFGYKVSIPSKSKLSRSRKAPAVATKKAAPVAPAPNPKIIAIEKQLAAQRKKLETASSAGKPEKPIQDRIYELEDELRLAKEK